MKKENYVVKLKLLMIEFLKGLLTGISASPARQIMVNDEVQDINIQFRGRLVKDKIGLRKGAFYTIVIKASKVNNHIYNIQGLVRGKNYQIKDITPKEVQDFLTNNVDKNRTYYGFKLQ